MVAGVAARCGQHRIIDDDISLLPRMHARAAVSITTGSPRYRRLSVYDNHGGVPEAVAVNAKTMNLLEKFPRHLLLAWRGQTLGGGRSRVRKLPHTGCESENLFCSTDRLLSYRYSPRATALARRADLTGTWLWRFVEHNGDQPTARLKSCRLNLR